MRVPKLGPDKPVTYLWERHKEIARLILCGKKPIEICRDLGYTPTWMSVVMNSPVFVQYLASLRERTEEDVVDVRKRLSQGAERGVMQLLNILSDDHRDSKEASLGLKSKVAMDFLDRAGYPKVSKVDSTNTVVILDANRIAEIKANRQAKLANLRQEICIN